MDPFEDTSRRRWRGNLLAVTSAILTVLLGLLLAQLDVLQARAVPPRAGLPIVNIQATAVAAGQIISLSFDTPAPAATDVPEAVLLPTPDDLNPRPELLTRASEGETAFTVCGEVPGGWFLYSVQPGESLAALAEATGTTAADLAAANCLAEGQLAAGMIILVPREPAVTQCGPPQFWVRYQVRSGDTLGALAINRGTTVAEILRANCRDTLNLVAGQFIFLPPGGQPGGGVPILQPSLTPLPSVTNVPTLAPLSTATATSAPPPPPPSTPLPSPTPPVVNSPVPPTVTPPPPPTDPPATLPPLPTEPPPTEPPPTLPPPTDPPPTVPAPTQPPPTVSAPTEPPPTEPPPTEPLAPDPSPTPGGGNAL